MKTSTLGHTTTKEAKETHRDSKGRVHSGPWTLDVDPTLRKLEKTILQREETDGIPREFEYLRRRLRQEMENLDRINVNNRDDQANKMSSSY